MSSYGAHPDTETPERERYIVHSKKVILTIIWNPGRFPLVNILPKEFKFDASYRVTQILDPLSKWRRTQVRRSNRKLIVNADNARPKPTSLDTA
jgi:hypothetical protein